MGENESKRSLNLRDVHDSLIELGLAQMRMVTLLRRVLRVAADTSNKDEVTAIWGELTETWETVSGTTENLLNLEMPPRV